MLTFHDGKAHTFIVRTMGAYEAHTHLYAHIHHQNGDAPQQRYCPTDVVSGSLEHRRFLFGTTLRDYLSISNDVFVSSLQLWSQQPDLFGVQRDVFGRRILDLSLDDIVIALSGAGCTFPKQSARRLHGSFRTLYENLDGDPANIFACATSIDGLVRYAKWFGRRHGRAFLPGYKEKLLSLLAMHFYDFDVLTELYPGSFPVDRHIQRQLVGCGVVTFDKSDEEMDAARTIAEGIRIPLVRICKEMGVSTFDLAHAMWFLGNRLCQHCRGWQATGKTEKLVYCPVRDMCSGGIETRTYQLHGKWRVKPMQKPDSPQLALLLE